MIPYSVWVSVTVRLWRCWLGGRKGIRPVKNWVVGCWRGYLSGVHADLHMAQLMPLPLTVSCFSKTQVGFTFLVPAHPGSPGQRAVKRVCVCVCLQVTRTLQHNYVTPWSTSNSANALLLNLTVRHCHTGLPACVRPTHALEMHDLKMKDKEKWVTGIRRTRKWWTLKNFKFSICNFFSKQT